MNTYGFTSAFALELDRYLAFKQSMGCYGASRTWYLRQFDAYCTHHGRSVFDRDTVEGWVTQQLDRSGGYRSWMSYVRDFGRWLQTQGHPNAYVLSDAWKASFVPAHPYLLTTDEIERFFAAAARLESRSPWRWQATAFFTLVEFPREESRRGPQDRVLFLQDPDLGLQLPDVVMLDVGRAGTSTGVGLGLPDPAPQGLLPDAQLRADHLTGLRHRPVLGRLLGDHPDRPLLRRGLELLRHCCILPD
jgi:hypothetical protein